MQGCTRHCICGGRSEPGGWGNDGVRLCGVVSVCPRTRPKRVQCVAMIFLAVTILNDFINSGKRWHQMRYCYSFSAFRPYGNNSLHPTTTVIRCDVI